MGAGGPLQSLQPALLASLQGTIQMGPETMEESSRGLGIANISLLKSGLL